MLKRILIICCLPVVLAGLFVYSHGHASAEGYTEKVFWAGYNQVTVVNPAVPEIVASIKIKGPARDMSFTEDGKKGLFLGNGRTTLYVVDTVQNKVIDEINLSGRTDTGLLDRRVFGSTISPDGTKAYAFVTQGEKQVNRYKLLPSKILEIDLKTKEVLRSTEAPYGVHVLQFNLEHPGKILVWGYDLYTLDVKEMKLTLTHGIKHPEKPEDGSTNMLLLFPRDRESNMNIAPVITSYPDGRVTEGILWYDFKTEKLKTVAFDKEPVGMFSAVANLERTHAYVIMNHWYKVDMKTGHVLKDIYPPTGTIYDMNMSADGKKLYLGGGGNDFIIADMDMNVQKILKMPTDGWNMKVVRVKN